MCCLKKALCAAVEWRHILKNCSAAGIPLHVDSLLFLLLTHQLPDFPSVETEEFQLCAFLCFMTASSLFCMPVHSKRIQNTVLSKSGRYSWSEHSAKNSKEISFSSENF